MAEEFWIFIQTEFKNISEKVIKMLFLFSTSYLYEHGFSALTFLEIKKRERLTNVKEEMRVALSLIRPNIENIYNSHQAQLKNLKISLKIVIIFY